VSIAAALISAGFVTHPLSALAAPDSPGKTHVVFLQTQGTQTQYVTAAPTVAEFLKERGILPGTNDYVRPAVDSTISDNLIVQYSAAVPVTLVTAAGTRHVLTSAPDVGALLEEQNIHLQPHDVVHPSLDSAIVANARIRIANVISWIVKEKHRIAERTIHEIDFSLAPHETRVVKKGAPGETLITIAFTQTDGHIRKRVVSHKAIRKAQPRVIAEGVGTQDAIAQFAHRSLEKMTYIASGALQMVATAYTAECGGCSGYTSSGYRAGHGIVAVDPRVIPLGTKLYIPGYGYAIAGDTGGAIIGRRIDLGFNSVADAMQFGRRVVKVYTLH
jgi:3D (Asp-Asp-Asp) domain-containing protein